MPGFEGGPRSVPVATGRSQSLGDERQLGGEATEETGGDAGDSRVIDINHVGLLLCLWRDFTTYWTESADATRCGHAGRLVAVS